MFDQGTFSDLDVLDCLEIFGSTVRASEWLGISQSTCSRRYRQLSDALGVDFDRVDGSYLPRRNADILAGLRQAAQRWRVRRGRLRYSMGWQWGVASLELDWQDFGLRLMDSNRMLSLLDQQLLDCWLGGLLEFQALLDEPLAELRARPFWLSQRVVACPLCRWPLQLLARTDHPLAGRSGLTRQDLKAYPSPGLPLGVAPQLMSQLQAHGLAHRLVDMRHHSVELWEAVARDGLSLSWASPQLLPHLRERYGLVGLDYPLPILEVGALVAHRDVFEDPSFEALLAAARRALQGQLAGLDGASPLSWLA